jgi:transcriptional regulator NrdR family protein
VNGIESTSQPVRGIECPECGLTNLVVDQTTKPCRGFIERRRVCENCGTIIHTREMVIRKAGSGKKTKRYLHT